MLWTPKHVQNSTSQLHSCAVAGHIYHIRVSQHKLVDVLLIWDNLLNSYCFSYTQIYKELFGWPRGERIRTENNNLSKREDNGPRFARTHQKIK